MGSPQRAQQQSAQLHHTMLRARGNQLTGKV
jgi:hypothetical protein